MFDPISMSILGGGALLGGGLSLAAGFMGQGAAADAQAGQLGFLERAQAASQQAGRDAQAAFAPYALYGSSALQALQSRVFTPAEQAASMAGQRASLEADVARLSKGLSWDSMPILTGAKASERRAELYRQMEFDRNQQLSAAQAKLDAFDKQQAAIAPYLQQQQAEAAARTTRINTALDLVSQASNFNLPQSLAQLRADMRNDPVFQFRQETGERAINRAAAARGNFLSGAALASIGDFNNQLTADETDRYFNRLLQGKTAQFQAAVGGLGALTGAQQLDVNNAMGLAQIGLNAATGQANVLTNTAQTNASLMAQQGQAYANTTMAGSQSLQQGINGFSQALGSAAGLATMASMFGGGATKPATAGAASMTGLTAFADPSGNSYLVNKPR